MSLRVNDDRGGRSRSRSKTRERDRSRSNVREPSREPPTKSKSRAGEPPPAPSYPDARYSSRDAPPSMPGGFDPPEAPAQFEYRSPPSVTPGLASLATGSRSQLESDDEELEDRRDRRGRGEREQAKPSRPYNVDSRTSSYSTPYPPEGGLQYPDDGGSSYAAMPAANYAVQPTYQYASAPDKISYSRKPNAIQTELPYAQNAQSYMPNFESYTPKSTNHPSLPNSRTQSYSAEPPQHAFARSQSYSAEPPQHGYSRSQSYSAEPSQHGYSRSQSYSSEPPQQALLGNQSYATEVREAKPRKDDKYQPSASSRTSQRGLSVQEPKSSVRAPSPSRLDTGMSRLSVAGQDSHGPPGQAPPPSPLLEAYHGTYQSMSPMPSPIMLPSDSEIDDLPLLSPANTSDIEGGILKREKSQTKEKRRVMIYDGEADAASLAKALGHSSAKPEPLIEILPYRTHDQLLALREEYKKKVKVQGKGVNIAKHIKSATTGNFGKVCYATALGRWESEAYWANFWYQSHSSNRELLIEALMGRTNADIREIKDSFKDKRYNDSLSKCMEKELKPDKFRMAVLLALDGKRQEETDTMPVEYRNRDVDLLHRAMSSKEGGETAMLQIIVTRSDNHLREVLKTYERMYQSNFARDALSKSNNLVGEVIAHILNGVINRAARDSLLLRHAIDDISSRNKAVELRYELLMSRLVRLHWDRMHMLKVKTEYKNKYNTGLEQDIKRATKGDFGDFCVALCDV